MALRQERLQNDLGERRRRPDSRPAQRVHGAAGVDRNDSMATLNVPPPCLARGRQRVDGIVERIDPREGLVI